VATLVVGAAPALAQQQREVRRTFSARDGMTVDLENLAGVVTVEGRDGGDIEVVATIHAESGDRADAQTLLGLLDVTFDERSSRINVRADYPVDRFDRYRYPQSGRGSYNTQTTYQRERVRVTSRGDDDAVTLWVDFVVRVPAGVSADIENHVGDVSAADLRGDFRADTGSGEVRASSIVGEVEADTGSGNVIVDEIDGDVNADTGSGDVEVGNVHGNVNADTGSGDVTVSDAEGGDINADTGSGTVSLERVSGDIYADTGSGDIVGRDIVAGASITADTGSGDVRFSGDLSGARQIEIDTSSGDVELDMSGYPGMSLTIETGSGSIDVDVPNLQTARSRRSYFRGTVGDGRCDVMIDTGSGSVRIRAR
jgi:DUF4097 and DUF4098 domain-containing protein YvlB